MALIGLHIDDPANRMTLKAMLEMEGHRILDGDMGTSVLITDDIDRAPERVSPRTAVLVLCASEDIGRAVRAMRNGVHGYIFLPFQPGEAALKVQRALESHSGTDGTESAGSETETGDLRRLEEVESDHIVHVLRRCKNNQAKAARVLGIGRNTLWRKLKKIETLRKTAAPEGQE